ncbi:hypothetical protein TNCV_4093101 [Trichonephila clavipes]|nr:hypothetical protein TNCV_4093101 [Trichonephila clavipes]
MDYTIEDIKSELENNNHAILDINVSPKQQNQNSNLSKQLKLLKLDARSPKESQKDFKGLKLIYTLKNLNNAQTVGNSDTQKFCRSSIKCRICSLNHPENECKETEIKKCSSCGEAHEANSKICKKYQDEVEILKIKVQQQISRNEAVEKFQNFKKTTYSAKTYNNQTEKTENLEKN